MSFHRSRLRAWFAAGGFVFLLLGATHAPHSLQAQENFNAPVSDRDAARRAIEQLPAPPQSTRQSVSQNPSQLAPQNVPQPSPAPTPEPTIAPPAATSQPSPAAPPHESPGEAPGESLRAALSRLHLPLPLPQARLVVTKSRRTMELFCGDTLVRTYRVALGANPAGHKQSQGDGRTPEGQFYICTRNDRDSAFHIFLGLSYPALPDATRGVNDKVISWREYQVIRQRLASRGAPLWGTRLGGWVGIHGGTGGAFAQKKSLERGSPDWTAGCIALTDQEIEEVYAATTLGTPVLVKP